MIPKVVNGKTKMDITKIFGKYHRKIKIFSEGPERWFYFDGSCLVSRETL